MALLICGSMSRFPVGLGRAMHEAGYRALGLDAVYVPFACRDVAGALAGMRALGIRGLGVSMPFKLEVLPLLDDLSPDARRIGAVNTIVQEGGALTGHNTDASGALAALLEQGLVEGRRALLLGAGGAARAVGVALAGAGVRLAICNRSADRAAELASLLGAEAAPADEVTRAGRYDLVINASSRGMADVDPSSPVPEGALRAGQLVMDIVYKPIETALVRQARAAGARVVSGERMLLHQAMGQFRLYTGQEAPREAMEEALRRQL
jgi:shikimate dehydrogenase